MNDKELLQKVNSDMEKVDRLMALGHAKSNMIDSRVAYQKAYNVTMKAIDEEIAKVEVPGGDGP